MYNETNSACYNPCDCYYEPGRTVDPQPEYYPYTITEKDRFTKLVEHYMRCDKRTLAEMLALKEMEGDDLGPSSIPYTITYNTDNTLDIKDVSNDK